MKVYAFLKGAGILAFLIGALALADYLGGQIREGFGSELSLVGGGACLGMGIIVAALGDLGTRVVGIQQKLGALQEEDRLPKSDP